jgi:hypothetical protein
MEPMAIERHRSGRRSASKNTEHVRKDAAEHVIAEEEALENGLKKGKHEHKCNEV